MIVSTNIHEALETRQFFPQSAKGIGKIHQEEAGDVMHSMVQKEPEFCYQLGASRKIIHGDQLNMHASKNKLLRRTRGSFLTH